MNLEIYFISLIVLICLVYLILCPVRILISGHIGTVEWLIYETIAFMIVWYLTYSYFKNEEVLK